MNEKISNTKEASLRLYEKLVSGAGLEALASLAQQLLGNPLLAADKSCRVLFNSGFSAEEENPVWRTAHEAGYYPPEYLEALANDPLYQAAFTAQEPVLLQDRFSGCRCLLFRLACGGAVSGFAQLVELRRPITPADRELFAVFCRAAGTAISSSRAAENEDRRSSGYVLAELLNGNLHGDRLRQMLSAAHIEPKKPRCLFVIEKEDGERMYTEYVTASAEAIVRHGKGTVYGNRLLFLVDLEGQLLLAPRERQRFKEFLAENGLICGSSGRFENMNQLPAAYRQAVTASRLGRQMENRGPMYYLWEYTTYQMCDLLYDRCELMEFCNPLIMDIKRYDRENGTGFLRTLEEYVRSGGSPVRAAASLGIHRNTVDYRISRMKELFDLDVTDQNLIYSFRQSFQILYYLEKNERQEEETRLPL